MVKINESLERMRVHFDLPFSLKINGKGTITTKDFIGDVELQIITQKPTKLPNYEQAEGVSFDNDDTDFLEFSRVGFEFAVPNISFDKYAHIRERDERAFEGLCIMELQTQSIFQCANKLIDSARMNLDLFFLQRIHDVARLRGIVCYIKRVGETDFSSTFGGSHAPIGGLTNKPKSIPEHKIKNFDIYNKVGTDLQASIEFHLDARFHQIRKNFHYSILLSTLGFEYFLKELLALIKHHYTDIRFDRAWIDASTLPKLATRGLQGTFGGTLSNKNFWGDEAPEMYVTIKALRDYAVHRDIKNLQETQFHDLSPRQLGEICINNCTALRKIVERKAIESFPDILKPIKI